MRLSLSEASAFIPKSLLNVRSAATAPGRTISPSSIALPLLSSLTVEVRKKVLKDLLVNKIINQDYFAQLNKPIDMNSETKNNLLRFLRIMLAIFTNPYGIELRRKKIHIYEKTGFLFNYLKNLYSK